MNRAWLATTPIPEDAWNYEAELSVFLWVAIIYCLIRLFIITKEKP